MASLTTNKLNIEKQANISVWLITGLAVMIVIYINCTHNKQDESVILNAFICPILTILIGMYTFTYRGKASFVSRVIFYIFLSISLLIILALIFLTELGQAYVH